MIKGLVKFETGPTCGKAGNKNVNIGLRGYGIIFVTVYYLKHVIIDNSNGMNLLFIVWK